MSGSGQAFARTDANHADLRLAARKCGYFWIDTYRQGEGCPDAFIVSKAGVWIALEIKAGDGRLTTKEQTVAGAIQAHGAPYAVVRSWDELAEVLGRYDE